MIEKMIKIPKAAKIEKRLEIHGDIRIDNFYWLNEKGNPEVIAYLNEENEYYSIDYGGFSTIAIKAIQEQQEIIENQASAINELQLEIEKLKAAKTTSSTNLTDDEKALLKAEILNELKVELGIEAKNID